MLVKELKENDTVLSSMFLDTLPEVCSCGFPYEIEKTLGKLRCSNPKCPLKIVKRTKALMDKLGVVECTEKDIKAFVERANAQDPYLIFGYSFAKDGVLGKGVSEQHSKDIQEILNKKNTFTLGDFLLFSKMPLLDSSIRVLGTKYDSIQDLLDNLTIDQLTEDLGYKKNDEVLYNRVIQVYRTLITYKTDLIQNSHLVNIKPLKDVKLVRFSYTDNDFTGYNNVNDFVAQKNTSMNKVYLEHDSFVYPNTEYFVTSTKEEKFNLERAKQLGIPIVTIAQFLEILDKKESE